MPRTFLLNRSHQLSAAALSVNIFLFGIMEFSPRAAELTTLLESRITNFYTNFQVDNHRLPFESK